MTINKLSQNKLGHRLGQPIGKRPLYSRILSTRPSNLIQYLPMSEPLGSTIALDRSLQGNNGAYTAVTLGVNGIGDGRSAGSFNGITSFVNAYSATLNADFDGEEYTFSGRAQITSAGVWSDASERDIVRFTVNGSNVIIVRKTAAVNQLQGIMLAGGVNDNVLDTSLAGTLNWFSWVITASLVADEFKFYLNGTQVGVTQTGLGTFVGNLSSTMTVIGASNTTPLVPWSGNLAHVAIWNTPLSASEIARLAIV